MKKKLDNIIKALIILLLLLIFTSIGLTGYLYFYNQDLVESGKNISGNIGDL